MMSDDPQVPDYPDYRKPTPFPATAANMTLLDYFAGQALPIVIQFKPDQSIVSASDAAKASAEIAYDFAAAMLAERAKRTSSAVS